MDSLFGSLVVRQHNRSALELVHRVAPSLILEDGKYSMRIVYAPSSMTCRITWLRLVRMFVPQRQRTRRTAFQNDDHNVSIFSSQAEL